MSKNSELMTFGGHLEVFRQMLFRVLGVVTAVALAVFCFKDTVWRLLLAPGEWNFVTYRLLERMMSFFGFDLHFEEYHIDLIATDLSSQFMMHITTSCYLGVLGASPFVLYELFRFVSPALYETEKRHSAKVAVIIYLLFMVGVLMSYFILFPISFRFLGTYSVSEQFHSAITIDSYVSTFMSLTLVMGVVFQLPVIAFFLAKMRIVTASILARSRKVSLIVIMFFAAVITPPDISTLILVSLPLYLLYEVSIKVVKIVEKHQSLKK